MSEVSLYYCCLYDPTVDSPDFSGQKNLSRHVLDALNSTHRLTLSAITCSDPPTLPSVGRLIAVTQKIARHRRTSDSNTGVTVVDMVHSLASLPEARYGDSLIVIGHDSYALRARRELEATKNGPPKIRRMIAYLAWRYLEHRLGKICHKRIYVSPIDAQVAASDGSALVMPIPLTATMRRAATMPTARSNGLPKRLLVPVPVLNTSQNRFDLDAIAQIRRLAPSGTTVTVWGAAADYLASQLPDHDGLDFVSWADDYQAFLSCFDLLIYPRIIGSGFHGKISEALATGLPCVVVDWVAHALTHAGYGGLLTFSGDHDFAKVVGQALAGPAPRPRVPKGDPARAMAPLLTAVDQAKRGAAFGPK